MPAASSSGSSSRPAGGRGSSASRRRRSSARRSPGCARTSASELPARQPSRWSATTRAPTSRPPSASGMRGVLVLSGKTGQADLATAAAARAAVPDGIAATLADVVAALD